MRDKLVWLDIEIEDIPWVMPSFKVAPQNVQQIVRPDRESGSHRFALMCWGLVSFCAKDAELAFREANVFRESYKRCDASLSADQCAIEGRKILRDNEI